MYRFDEIERKRHLQLKPSSEMESVPPTSKCWFCFMWPAGSHNPIGMAGEFNAGNNYSAKCEMDRHRLEGQNLRVDQDSVNHKLRRPG